MTTPTPIQQFFDRGYLGLQAQGFQRSTRLGAHSGAAFCMYRGPGNTKCFVGHNIDDADYKPLMDEAIWSYGDFQAHSMFTDIEPADFNSLQHIHDAATSPADMEMMLKAYAKKRDLILPTATTADKDAA